MERRGKNGNLTYKKDRQSGMSPGTTSKKRERRTMSGKGETALNLEEGKRKTGGGLGCGGPFCKQIVRNDRGGGKGAAMKRRQKSRVENKIRDQNKEMGTRTR